MCLMNRLETRLQNYFKIIKFQSMMVIFFFSPLTPKSYFTDDWFSLLGEKRPHFRWVVIGPERSGSPWHVDPTGASLLSIILIIPITGTSAWNAVISGRKRWAFYPPGHTPPGVYTDVKGKYQSPYPLEWFLYTLPNLPPELRPIEVVQEPGELIFVPHGWWHCVLNLEGEMVWFCF